MSKNRIDEPAFPLIVTDDTSLEKSHTGMYLRDWFAGMALQGLLQKPDITKISQKMVVMAAYLYADEMLKERSNG